MKLRKIKRRTAARVLGLARQTRQGYGWWLAGAHFEDDWDDDGQERHAMCEHCDGTGGDPWNDGITPCEHCDGEGYEWW